MPVDQARGSVNDDDLNESQTSTARAPGQSGSARTLRKQEPDDLWSRIVKTAKKEKLSYMEVAERCAKEYWNDYKLDKRP